MSGIAELGVGFVAACAVAYGGYRARALSPGGALAAVVVGTAIIGFGGWRSAALMVAFFVLSSALSRLGRSRKHAAENFVEKSSTRDAWQVLANGGVAAVVAVVYGVEGGAGVLFAAFVGSMAAATSDTWSTEIGSLSSASPRSILSGKPVPAGSSGGVTSLGLAGALAGAVVIGLIGGVANQTAVTIFAVGVVAGFTGSLVDSVLGASVQQVYCCPQCEVLTERSVHVCGSTTTLVRGVRGVNNDAVNGLTTLFGALAGALLFLVFS